MTPRELGAAAARSIRAVGVWLVVLATGAAGMGTGCEGGCRHRADPDLEAAPRGSRVPSDLAAMPAEPAGPRDRRPDPALRGIYEDQTPDESRRHGRSLRVPPEYGPVAAVMVSDHALRLYRNIGLVRKIIAAGADVWLCAGRAWTSTELGAVGFDAAEIARISVMAPAAGVDIEVLKRTPWARDWGPLFGVSPDGELRVVDFNYFRGAFDDAVPRRIAAERSIPRVSVPLRAEDGLVTCSSRRCVASERLVEVNLASPAPGSPSRPEARANLAAARAVLDLYSTATGRTIDHVFPSMPCSATRHIDEWAKIVAEEPSPAGRGGGATRPVVLVNRIDARTVEATPPGDRACVGRMADFLETRTGDLERLGFRVVRVPMPVPTGSRPHGAPGERVFVAVRSYTNSLLVNGRAVVPRFEQMTAIRAGTEGRDPSFRRAGDYPDESLRAAYEREVAATYGKLGFEVIWENSDDAISVGGGIHCMTMQVPRLR